MAETGRIDLTRGDEAVAAIDAVADRVGGRVGLDAVLDDLSRRGRRTIAPTLKARGVFTWDRADRWTKQWMPQGITTSADAGPDGTAPGRDLLITSWHTPDVGDGRKGSRISVIDLASRRYQHVLLVEARIADGQARIDPLDSHAGGLVWLGRWLFVAGTFKGLQVCHLDDILRVPDDAPLETHGYRYVLPVRFVYAAPEDAKDTNGLRYSFVSLDRATTPPQLVVGEYGTGTKTKRLAHYELDPETGLLAGEDGVSRPTRLDEAGVGHAQGAVLVDGDYLLTTSNGGARLGSVHVGGPGEWRRHRWAVPMGPEDLTYWPERDELWSITEHPHRRWVFRMKRSGLRGASP